jgi:hypothetical protein
VIENVTALAGRGETAMRRRVGRRLSSLGLRAQRHRRAARLRASKDDLRKHAEQLRLPTGQSLNLLANIRNLLFEVSIAAPREIFPIEELKVPATRGVTAPKLSGRFRIPAQIAGARPITKQKQARELEVFGRTSGGLIMGRGERGHDNGAQTEQMEIDGAHRWDVGANPRGGCPFSRRLPGGKKRSLSVSAGDIGFALTRSGRKS